jgi:hypothetical protein
MLDISNVPREPPPRSSPRARYFYVYTIHVNGILRYIGKGSNQRMHYHVIEAERINRRRARGAKTDRTCTMFYRNLAEALRNAERVVTQVLYSDLDNDEAYAVEKSLIEDLHLRKRGQLWNSVDDRFVGVFFDARKLKLLRKKYGL